MSKLAKLIADASRAVGYMHHIAPGADVAHAVSRQFAGSIVQLSLADPLPIVSSGAGGAHHGATNIPAGQTFTLNTAIAAASRVAQAGAVILPYQPAPVAIQTDTGLPASYLRPSSFRCVSAASFSLVAKEDPEDPDEPEAEPDVSALPVLTAPIDMSDSASHAVHFVLTRKDRRDVPPELLDHEISVALALGIADLADRVLLEAIQATTPTAFTLAKAAAKGLKFAELRALAGTVGTGAGVDAMGALRVSGVPAELTDQAAASYVGAFTRAGIAIHDDVRVISKRLNANSDQEITVYLNLLPLLPDPSMFWAAA